MSKQVMDQILYSVSVREKAAGTLTMKFIPVIPHDRPEDDDETASLPSYIVDVSQDAGQLKFNWRGGEPNGPGATKQELEAEARDRWTARAEWVAQVTDLMSKVEQWAGDRGWSTRRIECQLDDSRIGKYKVPALVMQKDAVRSILEPVSRLVPGANGLAELSLMPSYADIASLYLHPDGWYVHYTFPRAKTIAAVNEAQVRPLSSEALGEVLAGMKDHVG